ncbi:energy transducer TonB [Actomonas aquatica]|uniref:Energy transducer TonB n=1 Tax=Actomonas aquatica TaxID=2866162 RepID=A0ABZ1C2Q2_9BACT|nr:energy transducer TonB [Opitutus sp. WL0086]WRQ85819.1 energy transducer TonB [Opitutus sp. WL0086]
MKTLRLGLFLVALGTATSLIAAPQPSTDLQITATRQIFPREATQRGLTEGWARVALAVDAEGKLLDYLVIAASDTTFADEAKFLIRTAKFSPPREDGKPLAVRTEVAIQFRNEGLYVVSDFQAIADLYLHGRFDRARPVRAPLPSELDRLPQPRQVLKPAYVPAHAAAGLAGRVVVDFYIDETGRVRLPSVVSSDHDELATLALQALSQWSFDPPTVDGAPTHTRVRLPFEFTTNQSGAGVVPAPRFDS